MKFEAEAEGMLMFEEKSATAEAGEDTIEFNNPSAVPHNVAIEDSSGKVIAETETISEGETSTTADLEPGTYTFFCSSRPPRGRHGRHPHRQVVRAGRGGHPAAAPALRLSRPGRRT